MPMTKTGEKVMRKMQDSYGAQKGKQVFHATTAKNNMPWDRPKRKPAGRDMVGAPGMMAYKR